jgi:hypothetical protein
MKVLPKILLASVFTILMLLPLTVMSDQLPAPLEKNLRPGVTVVVYLGQSLRFTTDVPVQISMIALDENRIRLQFRIRGGEQGQGGQGHAATSLVIYWENWDNGIYTGSAPPDWQTEVLLTESGFTEK